MSQEIQKLLNGNAEFRKKFFAQHSDLFAELVTQGQKPKAMLIACSDSRVDPSIIFNCKPGELFVVRNVANLVPPCEDNDTYHGTSAALEFGVRFLEVEAVIIFGHTQCGGIQALLESADKVLHKRPFSFIPKWMELARPAYDWVAAEYGAIPLQEKVTLCERYALINSLHNLKSFPWIQEKIKANTLSLHAWYFDLATGVVHRYQEDTGTWL